MKKKMETLPSFLESVFTKNEINYCEQLKNKEQNYAARFAAKESLMKALGTGWRNGISFLDINIKNDELGKPEVFLSGKTEEIANELGVGSIHLSISHIKELAIAYIVLC